MSRRPPRSTRTDTLFPYPTLFRSQSTPPSSDPGLPVASGARVHDHDPAVLRRGRIRSGQRLALSAADGAEPIPLKAVSGSQVVHDGSRALLGHMLIVPGRAGRVRMSLDHEVAGGPGGVEQALPHTVPGDRAEERAWGEECVRT